MKILVFTILALVAASCNKDNEPSKHSQPEGGIPGEAFYMMARDTVAPYNSANTYDVAGQLHADILEQYLLVEKSTSPVGTIISQLDSIAGLDSRFTTLSGYSVPTALQISAILNNPGQSTLDILSASVLGPAAQQLLTDFNDDVLFLAETVMHYNDIHSFIVAHEALVMADGLLTTTEKRILLTNSSIARYSYWLGRKPPRKKGSADDREWDTLITTLMAGTAGMGTSTANAIIMSAAAAAVANQ